jgi:hypothetical protein
MQPQVVVIRSVMAAHVHVITVKLIYPRVENTDLQNELVFSFFKESYAIP